MRGAGSGQGLLTGARDDLPIEVCEFLQEPDILYSPHLCLRRLKRPNLDARPPALRLRQGHAFLRRHDTRAPKILGRHWRILPQGEDYSSRPTASICFRALPPGPTPTDRARTSRTSDKRFLALPVRGSFGQTIDCQR